MRTIITVQSKRLDDPETAWAVRNKASDHTEARKLLNQWSNYQSDHMYRINVEIKR